MSQGSSKDSLIGRYPFLVFVMFRKTIFRNNTPEVPEIRLYIKHHFGHLSVTQSVATLYIADGLGKLLRNPFDSFSLILPWFFPE
jgi:hypothetical protein